MFKNESERWLSKTGDDTKRRGSIGQSNGANRVLSMNTPPQDRLFTKYHPEKNWQNYNEQTGKRCLPSHLSNWTHSMGQTILYLHPHDGNADAIWWDLKEEATNPLQKITNVFTRTDIFEFGRCTVVSGHFRHSSLPGQHFRFDPNDHQQSDPPSHHHLDDDRPIWLTGYSVLGFAFE